MDAGGYFFHAGRSDEVIISAGWTMSAVEIEAVLMRHPDVREAAVIGVADELRGQVAKALVVAGRSDADLAAELQQWVRERLSQHESRASSSSPSSPGPRRGTSIARRCASARPGVSPPPLNRR